MPGNLGLQRTDDLIVNAVLPVMLLHAEQSADPALEAAALALPARLPAPAEEVLLMRRSRGRDEQMQPRA